ncbi:hypothetical protein NXS19_002859 [Fusarium pseudograminearum]|nr:hypothetical protein NXS19_002859 [Fusarium pseudograminearum]
MLERFDTWSPGRVLWECCLDEKSHEPVMASLVLDRPAHQDENRTLDFIQHIWADDMIGGAIANKALYRGESQLQGPPMHHDELCYENRMLIAFGFLVQTDCQVMGPPDGFLPFSILFHLNYYCLGSVVDCPNTRRSFAMMVLVGSDVVITEHLGRLFQTGNTGGRGNCVLLIALHDAFPTLGVLRETNAFILYWKSVSDHGVGLCLFLCTQHIVHATTLRIGDISKIRILMTVGIQTSTQLWRKQAFNIEYEGLTNNVIITLAALRVERSSDVKQNLFPRFSLSPLPWYQENAFASLVLDWTGNSSCQVRWSYYGITDDFYEGQGCEEGAKKVGSSSVQGGKNHSGSSQQLQRPSTWPYRSSQKRKRSSYSEGRGEGNDDSGSNERNPHRKRRPEGEKDTRFACPFFKHNPTKFIDERSCCGPGWTNVQRVKEHIFRKHGPPEFQCSRCFADFESHSRLEEHRRSKVACEVRDRPSSPPHVDEGTMQLLKQRKKSTNPLTEIDKWYTVYKIIFPHETQVPSPYYELNERGIANPLEATAKELFLENLKETLPLETLTNTGLTDLIMSGAMSAFKRTFSALNDQEKTTSSHDMRQTTAAGVESWRNDAGPYRAQDISLNLDRDKTPYSWEPSINPDHAMIPYHGSRYMYNFGGTNTIGPWNPENIVTLRTTKSSNAEAAPEEMTGQEHLIVHQSNQTASSLSGTTQYSTVCPSCGFTCLSESSRETVPADVINDEWDIHNHLTDCNQRSKGEDMALKAPLLGFAEEDFESQWQWQCRE